MPFVKIKKGYKVNYIEKGNIGVWDNFQFINATKLTHGNIFFVNISLDDSCTLLNSEIKKSRGSLKSVNKLGVLYARYGLKEEAESEFRRILSKNENYVPALMNMGNIYYLNKNMEKALELYENALNIAPDNPLVLLSIARTNHELENYGTARKIYSKLKTVDKNLAMQFSYLDLRGEEAVRAAETGNLKEVVLWEEE